MSAWVVVVRGWRTQQHALQDPGEENRSRRNPLTQASQGRVARRVGVWLAEAGPQADHHGAHLSPMGLHPLRLFDRLQTDEDNRGAR